jgi:hypothetical protein
MIVMIAQYIHAGHLGGRRYVSPLLGGWGAFYLGVIKRIPQRKRENAKTQRKRVSCYADIMKIPDFLIG